MSRVLYVSQYFVNADQPGGLYDLLSAQDVVSDDTVSQMSTNHAQTIVGYKEGAAWDALHPDQ